MAWAPLDPITAARQAKLARRAADMQSPDPVTRYKARERAFNEAFAEMSRGLVEQARVNAKAYQKAVEDGEKFTVTY